MSHTFSPLRYPGGKSQFYDRVVRILDSNDLFNIVYCEPFAGGAGVALRLLLEGHASKIIINDLDPAIYAFWYLVIHDTDWLIDQIEKVEVNLENWKKYRAIMLSHNPSLRDLGFATFFLNRTNRSGILLAGPIGGKGQSGHYKLNCRFNKKSLIAKIRRIAMYRNRILLENMDAKSFIMQYSKNNNTFWFIDPPYYEKGSELYQNFFVHNDHVELASLILSELSASKWILTYDYCEQILQIYKGVHYLPFSITYSVQSKRRDQELLFWNNLNVAKGMVDING